MVVYLEGVERVVQGYAKTHARVAAPDLDERFRHALITIEDAFQEQQQRLLESDVEDLDVQIEVLTQQLKREGHSFSERDAQSDQQISQPAPPAALPPSNPARSPGSAPGDSDPAPA